MTETRCDRPYRHPAHDFVHGGRDLRCPGIKSAAALQQLLAERPVLVGVGVASKVTELEVMSA